MRELLREKLNRLSEVVDDKGTDMAGCSVWIRDMDHEIRGYKKTLTSMPWKCGRGEEWRESTGQNIICSSDSSFHFFIIRFQRFFICYIITNEEVLEIF